MIVPYIVHEFNSFLGFNTGMLSKLNNVHLSQNQFTNSIPTEIGNVSTITFFDVSGNLLSGSLPQSLGKVNQIQPTNATNFTNYFISVIVFLMFCVDRQFDKVVVSQCQSQYFIWIFSKDIVW